MLYQSSYTLKMLKFLGIIFIFFLSAILLLGVVLGKALKSFGSNKTGRSSRSANSGSRQNSTQKKFLKNEGEYVSYEEVIDKDK